MKPSTQDCGTYGHAQKMRASMTYTFGRLNGLGNMPWHESDAGGGLMVGNPSISVEVSSYMCFLHRCKLYHHNHLAHNWTIRKYQPGERGQSGLDLWGGGHVQRLLQAAYTVLFLCMLHFDEVLKIQVHNLQAHEDRMVCGASNLECLCCSARSDCPVEIKLFHLWSLPSCEAHICPVRALAAWLSESKITSAAQIPDARHQSSEQFLELFCNNLLDINIDPAPYGTHSFRRGGCQYLHVEKHWPLRRICEWGGWSAEFSNLTIVKYLISLDDPAEPREHFFDPNRPPMVKCPQCRRCCACA
ncbi:DNA breaking-rejoining enzyme [Suillus placidus]|uniref:DNA breaking-rejoining enzyme n=1 Tax=Suillus placidus TaxID=48579 RepID=A0A9P7A0T8_9AGAM|nr:DNA breaking-rejoining enzyme [Suillus placidus]